MDPKPQTSNLGKLKPNKVSKRNLKLKPVQQGFAEVDPIYAPSLLNIPALTYGSRLRCGGSESPTFSYLFPFVGDGVKEGLPAAQHRSMQIAFGYYLATPKAPTSAIRVKVWSKGSRSIVNAGTIPGLHVDVRHWAKGQLSPKAPQPQRDLLGAYTERLTALQADLIRSPRPLTSDLIRNWLSPQVDHWQALTSAMLRRSAGSVGVYKVALDSYRTYTKGEQPTSDNFTKWSKDLTRSRSARTAQTYSKSVAALIRELDIFTVKPPKVKAHKHEGIALTQAEVNAILSIDLSRWPHLGRVRDAFICACYSALRLSDWRHFQTSNLGSLVSNKKTGKPTPLPDLPILRQLTARNGGAIRVPQAANKHIKTIAQKAAEVCPSLLSGVTMNGKVMQRWEVVTSHTARRTFVSNGIANGVDLMQLIAITGHSTVSQLLEYHRNILTLEERMERAQRTIELVYPSQKGRLRIA